jgi:ureidoglycolate lyase
MNELMLKEISPARDVDAGLSVGLSRVKKISLPAEQLTAENFAPFGDVIEIGDRDSTISADGFLETYADLAQLDVTAKDGRPQINLLRATPRKLPLQVHALERYHLSSRTIMPLLFYPFMILVAPASSTLDPSSLRAFVSDGQQGVNIHRSIWQHPLIALKRRMNFLTIERAGPGRNREEVALDGRLQVIASL